MGESGGLGWGCEDILLEMETGDVWEVEQSFLHFLLVPCGLEMEKSSLIVFS